MSITFDDRSKHVITMNNFGRKWRFKEDEPDRLPNQHLEMLKLLDMEGIKNI